MGHSHADWESAYAAGDLRKDRFVTMSFADVPALGVPEAGEPPERIGYPGSYPYTRGVHATGYRGRLWTMRQFAGFASVADTNERFRYLLGQGQDGLSVAFDMPTLMGLDADDERALGEVGHCGVAVSSADDMVDLFSEIPLGDVSVSMTINGPAEVLFAFLLVAAEEQGIDWAGLEGTLQNDILKEYIAQKEWIFPPEPHMRLIVDMIEFCTQHVPRWNTISISGYHIREAGATAAQELAFTLADGFAYVEAGMRRGLDLDVFVPRLSFFFDAHIDFFEEIAKFRAARQDLGALVAGPVRSPERAFAQAALPQPNGGCVAHRPAAGEQHRAHGGRGTRRSARRHPIAAHQRHGRGVRAADGTECRDRSAHPAGDRRRDRE